MKKAVILLSGGLDSATCLAIALNQAFDAYGLTINYGQRHKSEIQAAKNIAQSLALIEHRITDLTIDQFGGSALTDARIDVPDYQDSTTIPVTYVPARNTIFLSIALGYAESIGAQDIFIGANAVDYSGYPDCRLDYFKAFQSLANLATKQGVEGHNFTIHTPLLKLTKAEIIAEGHRLNLDYSLTVSCYRATEEGLACGQCDSCFYRKKGFQEANCVDNTRYLKSL